MRNDFDEMTSALQKPKDFRLKVRNHHGLLTITSVAKLNYSEKIEISFSGTNPQTYQLLKTKSDIENNFKAFNKLIQELDIPEKSNNTSRGKIRYLLYRNTNIEPICDFIDSFLIDQPSIKNATLSNYIKNQSKNKSIKEWSVCIVSNTDEKVFINRFENNPDKTRNPKDDLMTYDLMLENEKITLGCSVRNQIQDTRNSSFYLISKNQIDDLKDRQVDLSISNYITNLEIKNQRSIEKKGLLLLYALDERGTNNVNFGIPIIGFSLHFPKIEGEEKISYMATINKGFDEEVQEDDDFVNENE
jgi:hypothetical protein